jgi:hypothetical protein
MKLTSEDQARLEQLVARDLNALPTRKAPASLHARVWAELERRAALPWWHRSFKSWPMSMRVVFVLTAVGVVWLALSLSAWSHATQAATQLAAPVAGEISWLQSVGSFFALLGTLSREVGDALLHRIPGLWLYGGIAVLTAMYLMLAGIGVAAYRTLEGAPTRA